MKRRIFLSGALGVAGCGLAERPYEQKREWPLSVARPTVLAPDPRGRALLLRTVQAGPGLETRGLRSLQRDGSVRSDFYETWAVLPTQGVDAALREWLAASGKFSAVLSPGSRLAADLIVEATLTEFVADLRTGTARATMSLVVLASRDGATRLLGQFALTGDAPVASDDPAVLARALLGALEKLLAATEQALAGLTRRG
jgi:cholesterol transport system auxiliary component